MPNPNPSKRQRAAARRRASKTPPGSELRECAPARIEVSLVPAPSLVAELLAQPARPHRIRIEGDVKRDVDEVLAAVRGGAYITASQTARALIKRHSIPCTVNALRNVLTAYAGGRWG